MNFEQSFMNHDQTLIKWWNILQNWNVYKISCFRFLSLPGNDWDKYQALKLPLDLISNSHFFLVLETLFFLYIWSPTLILVCTRPLCIVQYIRFEFPVQISLHQWLWIWFDSSIKTFQTWPKSNLLVHNALDTNLIAMLAIFGA